MGLLVRDAAADDASLVRAIALEAWPATYRGLLPDDFIEQVLERTYGLGPLTRLIEEAEVFLVAELDGDAVGYLHYGGGPHGPELHRLYLRPRAAGRGIGRKLLAELNSRLPPGSSYVALVHQGNAGALRFYERLGFESVGRVDGRSLYMQREGAPAPSVESEGCDLLVRYVVPAAGAA